MNYIKITKNDIANGPGVRVTLWVTGCTIHCNGCHNPQTWDFNAGKPFDEAAKEELFEALSKPHIQGITFSGGNPLDKQNRDEILGLIMTIHLLFPKKDIWCYTGYTFEEICAQYCNERFESLFDDNVIKYTNWEWLEYVDVLVDGPYIEKQKDITLPFMGSKNQRLIDVKETLKHGQIIQYKIN